MSLKVSVFGAGYVGLITGVCLADLGHDVLVVDTDQEKINQLNHGEAPLYEPGLEEFLKRNCLANRLHFTTDPKQAVQHGELQFIAVGTPSDRNGGADLQYVDMVAKVIGQYITDYKVVINKSTVPVGTAARIGSIISTELAMRSQSVAFDVVSNPEFLKQGAAIQDFMCPDRIIIGADSDKARNILCKLYAPLDDTGQKLIIMDIASAELTKYAANAFLATKISFINEISQIAEKVGANIDKVRIGIGTDPRISPRFLMPGCGFGGSCFPKDVRALKKIAENQGLQSTLLAAVLNVNQQQKQMLFNQLSVYFNDDLAGKKIALWGLAFKAGTDDMRESSSCTLLEALWQAGVTVQAYDPAASDTAFKLYGERADFMICQQLDDTLAGADALIIVTEWDEFRNPDFALIKSRLKQPVIFDGRNLFSPELMKTHGLDYFSIGRKAVVNECA